MAMNYIRHLTGFFDKVTDDRDLNPTHISLYIALFQFWNCNRFRNPISISRDEIMRISKISSKATYHKCLRELNNKAYIKYEPSYNPYKGSHVWLIDFADTLKPLGKSDKKGSDFGTVAKQVAGTMETAFRPAKEQHQEQVLVPSINNTNGLNISNEKKIANLNEQAKKIEEMNNAEDNSVIPSAPETSGEGTQKEKKLREKKKFISDDSDIAEKKYLDQDESSFLTSALSSRAQSRELNPTIEEVKTYFEQNSFPEIEAQKFFNYFASIGWLVGGRTPMVDWQASAQNWILNAPKFAPPVEPDRAKQLNAAINKDYSEPL